MSDDMVIAPSVQLARALGEVPRGAEVHGCAVVLVYAAKNPDGTHRCEAVASSDVLSIAGADGLAIALDAQAVRSREAAAAGRLGT